MQLKAASLNWALKHIRKEGDTDLFPQPFEFDVIKKNWPQVRAELARVAINGHHWQGPRRLMVPKSEFAFRAVCQLDPYDSILFAALVKEIGKKIEIGRSPASKQSVFSYRFDPAADGRLYSATTGWESFWEVSALHCRAHQFVLVTDISDWYNQIYHHTIENQLDVLGIGKPYWHAIRNLIANTSEGVSRGLPIGPHPSHLLAEMAMIPIDGFLESLGIKYCRYVDDLHIFCNSKAEAQSILFKLVDYLDKTQKIQLNKQKTSIRETEEFKQICVDNTVDKPVNDLERELLKTVRDHTRSPYERVQLDDLSEDDLEHLSQENVESVLTAYMDADDVDFVRLRWFIRRLAQVGVPSGVPLLVKRFEEVLPAVAEVGKYFESAVPNFTGNWNDVGDDLLKLYDLGVVQASEYLQVVILSLFSRITDLNHINSLTKLYAQSSPMCQRKIMLAAAVAKQRAWLSTLKSSYKNADPWTRRAIIYSLRELPTDERQFWLKTVKKRVTGLDHLIAEYVD